MGAQVTVLDVRSDTMDYLEDIFGGSIETLYSNPANIEEAVTRADLVIGAVLVPGAEGPAARRPALVSKMEKGSVIVDVAIDQGGCIETVRPTSHDNPTYEVDGVIHYCVPNMPGAVAHTSTFALTNVTSRYAELIASQGIVKAVKSSPALALGVNCWDGACPEHVARITMRSDAQHVEAAAVEEEGLIAEDVSHRDDLPREACLSAQPARERVAPSVGELRELDLDPRQSLHVGQDLGETRVAGDPHPETRAAIEHEGLRLEPGERDDHVPLGQGSLEVRVGEPVVLDHLEVPRGDRALRATQRADERHRGPP
jgi:hypothetical protein